MRERAGLASGLGAYLLWGVFPLYFVLLAPAGALEVVAQRVLWSLLTCLLLVTVLSRVSRRRGRPSVGAEVLAVVRRPRDLGLLAAASLVIAVNWLVFIYLTLDGRVVEASLGYYANPLVSVALAVVLLRERLRPLQWVALGLGALAVAVLTVEVGSPPLLGLTLAVSFGLYGLLKKRIGRGVSALAGLTVETALLTPVALAVVVWLGATGESTLTNEGAGHAVLLASAGLVTAAPLLLFGEATRRLTLTAVGMLQYLTPTLQLLLGVLVLGEVVAGAQWVGFALVWLALVVFSTDLVRAGRRARARQPVPVPVPSGPSPVRHHVSGPRRGVGP